MRIYFFVIKKSIIFNRYLRHDSKLKYFLKVKIFYSLMNLKIKSQIIWSNDTKLTRLLINKRLKP